MYIKCLFAILVKFLQILNLWITSQVEQQHFLHVILILGFVHKCAFVVIIDGSARCPVVQIEFLLSLVTFEFFIKLLNNLLLIEFHLLNITKVLNSLCPPNLHSFPLLINNPMCLDFYRNSLLALIGIIFLGAQCVHFKLHYML